MKVQVIAGIRHNVSLQVMMTFSTADVFRGDLGPTLENWPIRVSAPGRLLSS